jgi:hypothetical protein
MARSFQDWYQENKDRYNELRRSRYENDPDYRQRILDQNNENRKRLRRERKAALDKVKQHAEAKRAGTVQSGNSDKPVPKKGRGPRSAPRKRRTHSSP